MRAALVPAGRVGCRSHRLRAVKKPADKTEVVRDRKPVGVLTQPEAWGPECGGEGGVRYEVCATPPDGVHRITVHHRDFVDSIQLETNDAVLPKIGNPKKHRDVREDTFRLEPDEYLVGITVEYSRYVDRMTFHTDKRTYGPFGGTGGSLKKTLLAPAGRRVVGFTGRHWVFVDSIRLMIA